MEFNLSHNAVFPMEESFLTEVGDGYPVVGCPETNLNAFGAFWDFSFDDYKKGKADNISEDIVDLLPSDPFGMDINATVTAITGWIEDIENDFELSYLVNDETEVMRMDDQIFAGLNIVWNNAITFYSEKDGMKTDNKLVDKEFPDWYGSPVLGGSIEDVMGFSYEKYWVSTEVHPVSDEFQDCAKGSCDSDGINPPDALFFALGYLSVVDLLSVERVCKSLRDAVQNDPLLWRSIYIDRPFSSSVTNSVLLRLTSRARGNLQCLSLVECYKITDCALNHVLESNPSLTKLNVAGCVNLNVESILHSLRVSKAAGLPGIKRLRIGGLCRVTSKHFEEFLSLLGADSQNQLIDQKPRFYEGRFLYLSIDNERAIDIDRCPRCQHIGQVYDCPAESCLAKNQTTQLCRACTVCIARCLSCGHCINGYAYEETYCLDLLCEGCYKKLLHCPLRPEDTRVPMQQPTTFHQQASYDCCVSMARSCYYCT